MCGIFGLINQQGQSIDQQQFSNSLQKLTPRGPDSEGTWQHPSLPMMLGHKRLAILELSELGHQPIHSQSKRYSLVYNGEIYNFQKIFEQLKQDGCQVQHTSSDTQMLVQAIDYWGLAKTLPKLKGMFAFALWDEQQQSLTLCRDHVGMKPLYYGFFNGHFGFSSELKALTAHPSWQGETEPAAMQSLLHTGYIKAPLSIYKNIFKLLPGHSISLNWQALQTQQLASPIPFWQATDFYHQTPLVFASQNQANGALEKLLLASVEEHLIADVPTGAFLSSGIDSTLITAMAQSLRNQPIDSFTAAFDNKAYDESRPASDIAKHIGTHHHTLAISQQDLIDAVTKLPHIYDEPFADSSAIPTYLVSQKARQHVTVCLSGDGGDELFCGYNRYLYFESTWQKVTMLPAAIRLPLAKVLKIIPTSLWAAVYQTLHRIKLAPSLSHPQIKIRKFIESLTYKSPEALYAYLLSFWPSPHDALTFGNLPPLSALQFEQNDTKNRLDQLMLTDIQNYLPDDNLVKVDRASMAVSLESRIPMLDPRIVEFALRCPAKWKTQNHIGKNILRQILYRYVPQPLMEQPKMGFSVPVADWLRGPLRDWGEQLIANNKLIENHFNATAVWHQWQAHQQGTADHSLALWPILMAQAWHLSGT